MTMLQSTFRWCYRVFWYSLVAAVILLAIAISLMRIFLPDVKVYREQIEQLATAFLEQQVRIDAMDARLSGLTPLIIFEDVHLLDAQGRREIARFDEARLGLDLWRSLSNRKLIPKSFTVYGVKLGVILQEDGSLILRGLDLARFEQQLASTADAASQGTGELARWLFERSELSLRNSTVIWQNARRGNRRIRFDNVNIDLRNDGERHQLSGRVSLPENLGRDFEVALDFRGNFLKPQEWHGGFHARGRAIQLANWGIKPILFDTTIEKGLLDVDLWGEWQAGRLTTLSTELDAQTMLFDTPGDESPFALRRLSGQFDWRAQAQGWVLNAQDVQYQADGEAWPKTRFRVEYAKQDDSPQLALYSSFLRLQDAGELARHSGLLDDAWRERLAGLNPHGDVEQLHLSYRANTQQALQYQASANLKGISITPWRKFPGFTSLDGTLVADDRAGSLLLDDNDLQVSIPRLFRDTLKFRELYGRLDWWHALGSWHVKSTRLDLASEDISAGVSLQAAIPEDGASPWLDLQVRFWDGDVNATSRYLPVGIMSTELVHWLDTSLSKGRVHEGSALFSGRLHDFPFRQQNGTFITEFHARDVQLDYRKDWPAIMVKDGRTRFTGQGMQIVSPEAGLYTTRLLHNRIAIDDFRQPVLAINGDIEGELNDVVRFLVESPIAPQVQPFYTASRITGAAQGKLALRIPLSTRAEAEHPLDYTGMVQITDADLSAWDERLEVQDIAGRIDFSRKGIFSHQLNGKFTGQPIKFDLYTRQLADRQSIQLGMQGTVDIAKLPRRLPVRGLEKFMHGKTDWQGMLTFGTAQDHQDQLGSLKINSSLRGLSLDLPAPAGKPAPAEQEFNLAMQFTEAGHYPLRINYGSTVNSALLIKAGDTGLQIGKGVVNFSTAAAALPEQAELRVRGGIPELPIDAWRDAIRQMGIEEDIPGMDSLGIPLIFDMDYLHVVTRHDDTPAKAEDPRKVALINGRIKQFRYNDMQLGDVTIRTARTKDGIRIEKLTSTTANLDLSGEGSWVWRDGTQRTNLLLMISSEDVGSMVSSLGYRGVIRGGSLRGVLQANWDDSPNRFSYDKLNGSLGVIINDGALSEVNPGAGRLFGLLSLSELPRRLILDFSELGEGFKFKQIIGQVDIIDGDAYTENLRIISPIALISVEGRTGLASQDFDQDVAVIPNVSNTLPVISWLAWGGQVGALTLLLDQLFGEQMDESVAAHYKITGTWAEPEIEKLAVPAAEASPAPASE